MEFDLYTAVLLVLRDDAPVLDDAAADALQDAHLHHLATLHEQGHLLAAGPLADPEGRLRGLCILNVGPEEALELASADPAVVGGRFALKVMPWTFPAGAVHFTPTRFPHSLADLA